MEFIKLQNDDEEKIKEMSAMATEILREHYDPIVGEKQNDYMLEKFQSVHGIKEQLENGYNYYFAQENGENIGFTAFYPRNDSMYISKLYLYKGMRGKGYGKRMVEFVIGKAKEQSLNSLELNVNKYNDSVQKYEKMGFVQIRKEKNDIGHGYYMDDFVYRLNF